MVGSLGVFARAPLHGTPFCYWRIKRDARVEICDVSVDHYCGNVDYGCVARVALRVDWSVLSVAPYQLTFVASLPYSMCCSSYVFPFFFFLGRSVGFAGFQSVVDPVVVDFLCRLFRIVCVRVPGCILVRGRGGFSVLLMDSISGLHLLVGWSRFSFSPLCTTSGRWIFLSFTCSKGVGVAFSVFRGTV